MVIPQLNKVKALIFSLPNRILMLLFLLSFGQASYAASVTASLDKTTSVENEVVQLTLRADFTNTGNGPELDALKENFEILGKSQNSQFSFNLGTNTALSYWIVSLMPKSVGVIDIPAIKIGDHESNPLKLTVKNSPQLLDSNGNPPAMIKTQVSEVEPYLQQQVILSVKLYTSVALQNANLSVPSHPDLIIEQLVDDQMSYETINGTDYQVLTREYLAFPQRSGLLTIPVQTIQAMINTNTGRRMIKVQSEPLALQVLPIPASYPSDNWLPSEAVTVTTKLTSTVEQPRVGDTLIWDIQIQAKGALPEQIPTMAFNSTRAYKLYPKPAEFNTRKTAQGITGQLNMSIEVVPTEEGQITLPKITVPYWDTEQRVMQSAEASTKTLHINPLPDGSQKAPSPAAAANTTPLPPQSRSVAPISLNKPKPVAAQTPVTETSTVVATTGSTSNIKRYLIIALIASSLAMVALWFYLKRKSASTPSEPNVPTLQDFAPLNTPDEKSAYANLITCCRDNQLTELRSHLLEWARHRWGDEEITSVDDIKRLSASVSLTQLLMEAELMMYSQNTHHQWLGEPLAEALQEFTSGEAKPSQASQLKTLYPNF